MHASGLLYLGNLLLILNLAAAAPQNAPTLLTTDADAVDPTNYGLNGRIVNGEKAALRQFPHQVSLRRSWSMNHFCGGSIISEQYVLTAGHCMFQDGKKIQAWTIVVVAGQLQLSMPTSTTQKRGVNDIMIHPNFVLPTLQNDLTILELSVPFTMTPEVNKVPLAPAKPAPSIFCQVSGWGYPAEDVPITNNDLMYIDIPVLEPQLCRELLVNVTLMPPGMFCAGYLEGGKDACGGDSGGSMVCNGALAGVVSGGDGCARPQLPGLYADVSFYRDWITLHATVQIKENPGRNAADLHSASILLITALLLI